MTEKFIITLIKKSEKKLDKLILENCPSNLSLSRTKIQDLIKRKMVFDLPKKNILTLKTKTDELNKIILHLDENLQTSLVPEDLDIPIVFEDNCLVIFNKPANMIVHPVKFSQRGTLANFLIHKYQDTLPTTYDKLRPGIVHRLDKDTSGLIIVAKTVSCADSLIKQFKDRKVKKVYLAICIGNPLENLIELVSKPGIKIFEDSSIEVKTHIKRNSINREVMDVKTHNGKLAISRFSIQSIYDLGENHKLSLVRCEIETGRTHQIRVHAKLIGCPIFGDSLYKIKRKEDFYSRKTILSLLGGIRVRQMLHAHELSFVHPKSSKSLFFRGNLPHDFSCLLSNLTQFKTSRK